MKLTGALMTKPNKDVGSIRPKKGTNSTSHLNCLIHSEALQSLDIKNSIVKSAVSAFVSVDTFPLTKHLFTHRDSPFPRAASREI
jgi:hypothetical protein